MKAIDLSDGDIRRYQEVGILFEDFPELQTGRAVRAMAENPELAEEVQILEDGRSLLHVAVEASSSAMGESALTDSQPSPIIDRLLEEGANVDKRDTEEGKTALAMAVALGVNGVAHQLIAAGADPDARFDPFQSTPLHKAAEIDDVEIARVLIEGGADIDAENMDGDTPEELARRLENWDFVDYVASIQAERSLEMVTPTPSTRAPTGPGGI